MSVGPYTERESDSYSNGPEGVASLRISLRILLPLTWLFAAPLMGWGGHARADFDTPAALVGRPHADFFTDNGGPQAASAEMGSAAMSGELSSSVDLLVQDAKVLEALYAPSSAGFHFGAGSTGAASSGPSVGGFSPFPSVSSRPRIDGATLAGVLFLQAVGANRPHSHHASSDPLAFRWSSPDSSCA